MSRYVIITAVVALKVAVDVLLILVVQRLWP